MENLKITLEKKIHQHREIIENLNKIYRVKNKTYSDAASKNFDKYGLIYYLIKLSEKLDRLQSINLLPEIDSKNMQVQTCESLNDTLMDIANYCIMAAIDLGFVTEKEIDNDTFIYSEDSKRNITAIDQAYEDDQKAYEDDQKAYGLLAEIEDEDYDEIEDVDYDEIEDNDDEIEDNDDVNKEELELSLKELSRKELISIAKITGMPHKVAFAMTKEVLISKMMKKNEIEIRNIYEHVQVVIANEKN